MALIKKLRKAVIISYIVLNVWLVLKLLVYLHFVEYLVLLG